MLFNSLFFLFLFFPCFLAIYHTTPNKYKNIILLLGSLFFYVWSEQFLVLLIIFSTFSDFFYSLLIDKGYRKIGLGLSIVSNLGLLAFFKYSGFLYENFCALNSLFGGSCSTSSLAIILPIGISFYTFQTMSYTIDVYRGRVKASRNFIEFATYVSMFPQLIAGPIVRYADIQPQLAKKEISLVHWSIGIERFIIGLAKKVLLADTLGAFVDTVFNTPLAELSMWIAWLGIIAYALQIYYDFSGYSDMAIGLGYLLGFKFLENFHFPYIAQNIQHFWRRWHISLSTWFRDYLYIPLGGNRVSTARLYLNIFIVFLLTGLWHGASWNFVVWGLIHGIFIIAERSFLQALLNKTWAFVRHLYTLVVVLTAWVFFRADDLSSALSYLYKMYIPSSSNPASLSYIQFYHFHLEFWIMALLAIFFAIPLSENLKTKLNSPSLQLLKSILLLVIFVLCLAFISGGAYTAFIYLRF